MTAPRSATHAETRSTAGTARPAARDFGDRRTPTPGPVAAVTGPDGSPVMAGQLPHRTEPGDSAAHVAAQRAAGHNQGPGHNPSGVAAPMSADLGRRTVAGLAGIPDAEPWDGTTAQFDAFTVDRARTAPITGGSGPSTAISTLYAAMAAGRRTAQAEVF